ncbi:SxtJ family membrane protein [Candidatus Pelagibacter sp.]|nr:SxtJ family membrane protein [Candidatus Pelagibacter sp.]
MRKTKNKIKIGSDKSFGFVFCVFFLIISFWPLLNGNEIRIWSLVISVIFLIITLTKPILLSPLNKIWFKIGIFLGSIVSPIIMGIVFFGVVTPISLIMKILGKDLLKLKKNKTNSYWIERSIQKSNMKKQF